MSINVTVQNQGNYTETFNVTAYYDDTPIETKNVTLFPSNETTITFTWNTTGVPYGNYTISARAIADTVPGETDTTDNTLGDGWVIVTVAGDVNGDGIADPDDFNIFAGIYGTQESHPQYNPNCDFDNDGDVDPDDFNIFAGHYGQSI